jgi:hypothetical protein
MRKQNKGKFHFWSYIGTLGFGRQTPIFKTELFDYSWDILDNIPKNFIVCSILRLIL